MGASNNVLALLNLDYLGSKDRRYQKTCSDVQIFMLGAQLDIKYPRK